MIAVGGAGGGIDESFDSGVSCGNQHIEVAADIVEVGGDGIFNGSGDGAEGGLMEDVINSVAGVFAGFQVADVPFHEAEVLPLCLADQGLDLIEVVLEAGGEVIEAYYSLVEFKESFEKV